MIWLALGIVGLVALLWTREFWHDNERQKLLFSFERERRELLQRIQAPEIAVYENAREDREPMIPIGYEDDAAFAEAKRQREQRGLNGH